MNIKVWLGILASFLAGGATGLLIGDRVVRKKYSSSADVDKLIEEINTLHSELDRAYNLSSDAIVKESVSINPDTEISEEIQPDPLRPASSIEARKGSYKHLQELAAKYHDPDLNEHLAERDHPREDDPEEELDVNGFIGHPVEISREVYEGLVNPPSDYQSLDYYPMDDVMADATGAELDEADIIEFIGQELRSTIRDRDDDVILVLNHPYDCVYEVTLQQGSSYHGMDDGDYMTPEQADAMADGPEEEEEDEDEFDPRYPNGRKF